MITSSVESIRELVEFLRSDRSGAVLVRGGAGSFALKLLHAGLILLVAVVLARSLGPTQFGLYSISFAVVTFLAIPVQFGLPMLVVRETATGRARLDEPAIRAIWKWSLRFTLTSSTLIVIVFGSVLALGWGQLDLNLRWTLVWALPLLPLMALGALHGAALRGFDRLLLGQLPDHVLRLAIFAVLVLIGLAWTDQLSAPRAMGMHVAAAAFSLLAAHAYLRRVLPCHDVATAVDVERSRRWMLATLPLGFIAAAQIINARADTLLLGVMVSSESVGIYQVANQGAQAVAMALGAVSLVLAPRFAVLYQKGEMKHIQRLAKIGAKLVILVTLPAVLILFFYGAPLILLIFGSAYQQAHSPLAILAAGQVASAFFGTAAALLNMTGHEHVTARGLALAAGINIVLNLTLIPPFGINGAAAATAFSMVAWSLMLWRSTWRILRIDTFAFSLRGGAAKPAPPK